MATALADEIRKRKIADDLRALDDPHPDVAPQKTLFV
jgi:hypothetical protein